ncbi:TPA: hypothetical protein ACNAB9_004467 [Klebsiella pneumoniae]
MSTITREFTKEQLQQIIETDHVQCGEASSLARIALASLEAEPRGYIDAGTPDDGVSILTENKLLKTDIALYTAPPAPANSEPVAWLWSHRKHPSEVTLVRPEDDERAEGAHWSGWNCQALYAAPPAPASVPDEDLLHMAASAIEDLLSNKDRYCAGVWADIPAKLRRAAMLQGAENAESRCTIQTAPVLDSLPKIAESRCSNSLVIPDDVRRMDWLVSKTVDVREPMVYGSHSLFWSQTITDEEDDYHATKLREQIDAAMEAEQAAALQQEVKP